MSNKMNYEKVGKCFFKLINKNTGKGRDVYLSNYEAKKNFDILEADENKEFVLVPCKELERQIIYVSGKSGSGKSYFMSKYAEEYHKIYPKRGIYLFSLVGSDKAFDKDYIKRVDLNKLMSVDLQLADFKDTLIIMDDIDMIKNKAQKEKLKRIEDNILLMGRHHNISLMVCGHVSCRGNETKNILNESHIICLFPINMAPRPLKYICDEYIGLDKEGKKDFIDLARKSRSVCYIRNYPPVIFSNKKCFVLIPKIG